MGILSRSADLVYTFRFLKLLVTPWEETSAYKNGIVDESGKRTSKRLQTSEEKSSYNTFHRLVFNIKRLIEKVPGGSNKIASYAAALFLLKEKADLSDKALQKILDETGITLEDMISEESSWYVDPTSSAIHAGLYKLREDKVVNSTLEPIVKRGEQVRVEEDCYPIGYVFDIPVYEVRHVRSNQKVYITSGEIRK